MRRVALLAAILGASLGGAAWVVTDTGSATAHAEPELVQVVFEDPIPPGPAKKKDKAAEECTTSCSLAKHPIAPFAAADFEVAMQEYAKHDAEEPSEPLERLLFYGPDTRRFLETFGADALPAQHLRVLERELARDHAMVSLRLVDEADNVVVVYGPHSVPIGQKQHLAPVGDDLQAMEFNGTVMRTGVNYLWSRY